MQKENETNHLYNVKLTEEFDIFLDHIQSFFADQGPDTLIWWYAREETLIDYLEQTLSRYPFIGQQVEKGPFIGFRRTTYDLKNYISKIRAKGDILR